MQYHVVDTTVSFTSIIHYAGLGYVLAIALIVLFSMGASKVGR
jgi:ABC-type microcin C transport system permease subunit YejB